MMEGREGQQIHEISHGVKLSPRPVVCVAAAGLTLQLQPLLRRGGVSKSGHPNCRSSNDNRRVIDISDIRRVPGACSPGNY